MPKGERYDPAPLAELYRAGLSYRKIASELGISLAAVEWHVKQLRADGTLERRNKVLCKIAKEEAAISVGRDKLLQRLREVHGDPAC